MLEPMLQEEFHTKLYNNWQPEFSLEIMKPKDR